MQRELSHLINVWMSVADLVKVSRWWCVTQCYNWSRIFLV